MSVIDVAYGTTYSKTNSGITSIPLGIPFTTDTLVLSRNQLSSPLDTSLLATLPSLKELDLSDNQLTEFPDLCSVGGTLKTLTLSGNKNITEASAARLACLTVLKSFTSIGTSYEIFLDLSASGTTLESINLSGNNISLIPDEAIQKLTQVTDLHIANNKLTEIPISNALSQNLRVLGVGQNAITIMPSEIANYTLLIYLQIGYNQIQSLPDMCPLIHLRWFYMSNNPFSALDVSVFNCFTNIQVLHLGGTGVTPTGLNLTLSRNLLGAILLNFNSITTLQRFPDLPKLVTFKINHNPNLIIPQDYFLDLEWPGLLELDLSNIGNTEFPDITDFAPTLTTLAMQWMQVQNISASDFSNMHQIQRISLDYNAFALFPTTCPNSPATMTVSLTQSSVDLCDCRNAWLKMLSEMGATVTVSDVACAGTLWSQLTAKQLVEQCEPATG